MDTADTIEDAQTVDSAAEETFDYEQLLAGTEYRLAFNGPITQETMNALRNRVVEVVNQDDFGLIRILLSSQGGSATEALAAYNFLRSLPVPIHMHAAGPVESAGVTLFLAGHRRTCSPHSRFLFHSYAWNFGEGPMGTPAIEEVYIRLTTEAVMAREIVERHCDVTDEMLEKMFGAGSTFILRPSQAVEIGFSHEIGELNPHGDEQHGVVVWTVF